MSEKRWFAASAVVIGLLALAHAAYTWPPRATLALFVGGAAIAYVAEFVVIRLDWLEHHIGPKALGVPLYVLFGWTGVIYAVLRVALFATDGWAAVVLAAVLATLYDVFADPRGVADGHWTYAQDLPGPYHRGVPWWNYAGWFGITAVTSALTLQFL